MRKVESCTCESREILILIRHFIEFLVKVGLVKVGLVKVGLIKWTWTVYPRLLYIVSINYLF